jgi:hypothetical protein
MAVLNRVDHHPAHHRAKRMQPIVQSRDDPQVRARATQTPKQIRIRRFRDLKAATIGRYDLGADQVVACQSEATSKPAIAAAQSEPRNARIGIDAKCRGQAVFSGRGVELPQTQSGGGACDSRHWIDRYSPHCREIDHHSAVGHGRSAVVVPATAHRDRQVVHVTTSSERAHRAIKAGRRSTMPFHTLRTTS